MYSSDESLRNSYAHIGQYCGCAIDYAKDKKEATKEQYEGLLRELEHQGYNDLEILNTAE